MLLGAAGVVEFLTVYPGWYRGRTVHIHAKVHLDGSTVLTTQFFFPDDVMVHRFAVGHIDRGDGPAVAARREAGDVRGVRAGERPDAGEERLVPAAEQGDVAAPGERLGRLGAAGERVRAAPGRLGERHRQGRHQQRLEHEPCAAGGLRRLAGEDRVGCGQDGVPGRGDQGSA